MGYAHPLRGGHALQYDLCIFLDYPAVLLALHQLVDHPLQRGMPIPSMISWVLWCTCSVLTQAHRDSTVPGSRGGGWGCSWPWTMGVPMRQLIHCWGCHGCCHHNHWHLYLCRVLRGCGDAVGPATAGWNQPMTIRHDGCHAFLFRGVMSQLPCFSNKYFCRIWDFPSPERVLGSPTE